MEHFDLQRDNHLREFLAPLGCVVRVLKPGIIGGYIDENGAHNNPTFADFTEVTVAGNLREARTRLLAKLEEAKGANCSVFVRDVSLLSVHSQETGQESLITLWVAFARVGEDVKNLPAFVRACAAQTQVSFGVVIDAIKAGYRAARTGWNGKGMFIYYVPASSFPANRAPLNGIFEEGTQIEYRAHMDMMSADGHCVVWTVSQSDALADDWLILPRKHEA